MASKILLVEDDNNLREIYEARLMAEGYAIVTAKDGEEALVVAKAEKPDLVVSDVMMPRISGFEMLDILRNTEDLRDTKVIMLTALGQADDKTRANSLGADRYLVKSQVTLEDIVKAAHELIGDDSPAPATPTPPAPAAPTPAPPATPVTPPAPQPPMPAAPPQPVAPPMPPAASMPEPSAPPTAASQDDAVLANAMNDLAASAAPAMPAPAAAPMPATPPAPEPPVPPIPAAEPAASAPTNDNVQIANKKIIQPLNSVPKQNIHDLLAQEEAKDAMGQAAPIPPTPPAPAAPAALNPDMLNMPTSPMPPAGHVVGPNTPPSPPSDPSNIAL